MRDHCSHVVLCLDRSQSMAPYRDATIRVVNRFTDEQKRIADLATQSRWEFNEFVDLRYSLQPVTGVRHLTLAGYAPMGGTRIASALATILPSERAALDARVGRPPDDVFVPIWTDALFDGGDRREVRAATRVRDLLPLLPNWRVLLLGLGPMTRQLGAVLGLSPDSVLEVGGAPQAIDCAWEALTVNVSDVRAGLRPRIRFSAAQRRSAATGEV